MTPLSTDKNAWTLFFKKALEAQRNDLMWFSPKRKKKYSIKSVSGDAIFIQREKGADEVLRENGYLYFLKRINDLEGELPRTHGSASVAHKATIAFLHPQLVWSDDFEWIQIADFLAAVSGRNPVAIANAISNDDEFVQQTVARRIRRGQTKFRQQLMIAYDSRCCVSGCDVEAVLEACHIEAHSIKGINSIGNGLLLRSDLHLLFDEGLLLIHPETHCILLHPKLAASEYWKFQGQSLAKCCDGSSPAAEFLKIHWENRSWN